ncbi:MAG: TonB-dependent receptor [Hyphomonadaceae bacterium]|nr:TonB-dependent receptor [Hyphomonadaceae bacterium]
MKFSKMSWMLLGCSFAAIAAPAAAQAPAEEEAIVVTAQNRAQNVQDVPISINVFSAEEIANAGITDFTGLKQLAPDVQITNDTQLTRVTLRGIGTNSNDETQDQSIAVSIDGEYINRPFVLNASIFDLERVEVLRGPQGTLYGRNATGGAITFITRRPGQEFSANGALTYGNYDQLIAEAGVTIPLGEHAALRIAGLASGNEGYVYHPNINRRSNDQGVLAGRAALMLRPNDRLEIYLAGELADVDQTSPGQAFVNLNTAGFRADETGPNFADACSAPGWVEVAPLVAGVQCIPQNTNYLAGVNREEYNAPGTGIGKSLAETEAFRGHVTYDFGAAMFTYRGGYRSTELSADTTLSPAYIFKNFQVDTETQSHELRLNGEADNGFVWQGGFFFFNEDQTAVRGLFSPFVGPNGGYITFFSRPFVETKSWAAFAQVEVPVTDQVTLVAGARYTDDERSARFDNYGFRANTGPVNLVALGVAPSSTQFLTTQNEKTTWLAGLNFEPTDDSLWYAKVSTGFKAGGFDSVGVYAPETVTAYEIGTKNTFGRYLLNASAFYYDYKDLQVGVLLDSTLGNQIFNAGAATMWGLEGQFEADVTDNDKLSLTVNYLNAEYDEFLASLPVQCLGCGLNGVGDLDGVAGNPVVQPRLDGNTPPRSPDWVLTAGWEHVFPLASGATLTFDVFSRYNSGYYTTAFNFKDDEQDAFTQTDVGLEYASSEGHFTIRAFARNLEDYRELTYAAFTSAGPDDVYNWQFGAPLTYGVRIAAEY